MILNNFMQGQFNCFLNIIHKEFFCKSELLSILDLVIKRYEFIFYLEVDYGLASYLSRMVSVCLLVCKNKVKGLYTFQVPMKDLNLKKKLGSNIQKETDNIKHCIYIKFSLHLKTIFSFCKNF